MGDLPFSLFRSRPFSWGAKERDSWELRRRWGPSLSCEQGKIVCVWAFLWFSSFCTYHFCRAVSRVGRCQGRCVVGTTKALPDHCRRVGSGSRLVGMKGTLLSWQHRGELMLLWVGVRVSTSTRVNLMAKLWGTNLPVKEDRLLRPACSLPLKSGQLPATVWCAVGRVNWSYFKQSPPKERAISRLFKYLAVGQHF